MLLETLDIKSNDVVIYSQNLFNLEKNFRIIYKDDPRKESHKINYSEVCRFVNEYSPKNLIVYRLLTNIKDFEIYLSKYGFFLSINGRTELIFFDPVYAVKELEDYTEAINYYDLRFRIQQVGLTTLNRKGDIPNYAEIYSIDLEATEAKFQNDKVFADAIFSLNKNDKKEETPKTTFKPLKEKGLIQKIKILDDEKEITEAPKIEPIKQEKEPEVNPVEPITAESDILNEPALKVPIDEQHVDGIRIIRHDISEDKNFDYKQIMKINFRGLTGISDKNLDPGAGHRRENTEPGKIGKEPKPDIHKYDKQKEEKQSPFGKFLKESQNINTDNKKAATEERVSKVLDMFKSASSLNEFIKDRENKQVVLKLKDK